MNDLMSAFGSNASSYEAIALKIIDVINTAGVSLEVGVIALKVALLILDTRERDAWDSFGKTQFNLTLDVPEASQVLIPDSEV